jgi:glycosyltransferase involved in cell wall biosynthesis
MRVMLFANTAWYLFNFRVELAKRLRDEGFDVLLVSPYDQYAAKLQDAGFRWLRAPMERRSLNPFRELRLLFWLYRVLRQEDVSLIHSFTIKCVVYGGLAGRLARGVRRVNAVAGLGYVFTSEKRLARLLRPVLVALMRVALGGEDAMLILQNRDDAAWFARARIVPSTRVRVIRGSGVDCSRFYQRAQSSAPRPLVALMAARLIWEKGIEEYVKAAQILAERGRDVHFLIAGRPDEGSPGAVPVEYLRACSASTIIDWIGHVDDMPTLLARVDIMVAPTRYGEGVPRALIEGAAAGLGLVATDMPGCREIVIDGETGLLVGAGNAVSLADALDRLALDEGLRCRLGERARELAVSEFDARVVLDDTLCVYRELYPSPAANN